MNNDVVRPTHLTIWYASRHLTKLKLGERNTKTFKGKKKACWGCGYEQEGSWQGQAGIKHQTTLSASALNVARLSKRVINLEIGC